MKTRNGFVSNSSTSSFLIYGVVLEDGETLGLSEEEREDGISDSLYHKIEENKLDLELHTPDYVTYVGKSWAKIRDDQTGAQFKQEVFEQLCKLLGRTDIKCETHEYAWRDG